MKKHHRRRKRLSKKALGVLIPLLLVTAAALALLGWSAVYYRADAEAEHSLVSDETVQVRRMSYGWQFDGPAEDAVLVFYPGGKVEESAYAPLLHRLAAGGLDVCLLQMPLHLAVLDADKALDVLEEYDYERCYVGGHSLGGAVAALFAADYAERLDGLILLAAYPTKPLDAELTELLIYGSEDGVLNRAKFEAGRQLDTAHTEVLEIAGGNHAQFGHYGPQWGDNAAGISPDEQQAQTADFILRVLHGAA